MRFAAALISISLICGCFTVTPEGSTTSTVSTTLTTSKSTTTTVPLSSTITCVIDGDCIGDVTYDVRPVCEDGKCVNKTFDGPEAEYCLKMGHRLAVRKQPSGIVYTICRFPNGNECEVAAYYLGRCGYNTSNLTDCSDYSTTDICTHEYNPICAKIYITGGQGIIEEWRTFSNPCMACASRSKWVNVTGYLMGVCITTTTLPVSAIYNAAAKFCEDNGFKYQIRKYASGKEYGVCVFGVDDECIAEEYFHSTCNPKTKRF